MDNREPFTLSLNDDSTTSSSEQIKTHQQQPSRFSSWFSCSTPIQLHGYIYHVVSDASPICVVLVHQWSKLGGCGQLMCSLARRLVDRGHACVTFDMRGVNKSTGSCSWSGVSEVEDVKAVCLWASRRFPKKRILLLGSSAGAPIAGSAVDGVDAVCGYVGIGYVFGFCASVIFKRHYDNILRSAKPKLFITGDHDAFTSISQFNHYFSIASEPKRQHVVHGVGHFDLEGPDYDACVAEQVDLFVRECIISS
eukprot:GHVS01106665.1.p1 GENE.GHVS01106665.1~~GHVS01106665.1.p1  ORF type:complete len:252 (+),score=28.08 GHVS01106665.1:310-1065(+)